MYKDKVTIHKQDFIPTSIDYMIPVDLFHKNQIYN